MRLRAAFFLAAGFAFATWLTGQSDRAEALKNPFAGDAAAIAAGKVLYGASCQTCHAPGGSASSFTSGVFQRGGADGEIFLNIRNGVLNTAMPPFTQVSTDRIWQVVGYMRSLAVGGQAPAAAPSTTAAGDPDNGKLVFGGKAACLSCHQFNGKGIAMGPDLTSSALTPDQIQAAILNPNSPAPGAAGRGGRGRGRGEAGRQYQARGNGGGFGGPAPGAEANTQGVMAIDPETGKVQWKYPLAQMALPPGLIATGGGVVFCATTEGYFIALDAVTGKLLWRFQTGGPLPASPISYAVDGKQFVAISGTNALFSFALPK